MVFDQLTAVSATFINHSRVLGSDVVFGRAGCHCILERFLGSITVASLLIHDSSPQHSCLMLNQSMSSHHFEVKANSPCRLIYFAVLARLCVDHVMPVNDSSLLLIAWPDDKRFAIWICSQAWSLGHRHLPLNFARVSLAERWIIQNH